MLGLKVQGSTPSSSLSQGAFSGTVLIRILPAGGGDRSQVGIPCVRAWGSILPTNALGSTELWSTMDETHSPPSLSSSLVVVAYFSHTSLVMNGGSITTMSNEPLSSGGKSSGLLKSYLGGMPRDAA